MNQQNQVAIFDLDGTLLNIEHRIHFIRNGNHDWDSFFAACTNDDPEYAIIDICNALYEYYIIWIFSGRSDAVREQTEAWLKRFGVRYNYLKMRPAGNTIPDTELKAQWIDEHELIDSRVYQGKGMPVRAVFDDRKRIVDMWRIRGFKVLQVEPGEF